MDMPDSPPEKKATHRWTFKRHDSSIAHALESHAKVSPVVARLLVLRGVTLPDLARRFIEAKLSDLRPPHELPGAKLAADLIFDFAKTQSKDAKSRARKIAIYGDYDCDGMTSTAILWRCLKMIGANVTTYVPNRLDDGYGLNSDAIKRLADDNVKMIITVDCGIASVDEVAYANQLGISMIVTDHHQPDEQLPAADAIVHPGLDNYPFPGLCGAGVALKLAWALCQCWSGDEKVSPEARDFLVSAVGLAAIGTVADVVPLVDENRSIVRSGLKFLKDSDIDGIRQLLKLTKLDTKPELSAEDIGFTIGPRLNAAGRLGQATLGVELLTSNSLHRVEQLAEYINNLNSSRDSIERKISKAANKQIKDQFDPQTQPAIVVADRGWHKGVIGIVAGRIADKYQRPTVVISLDEHDESKPGVGSCRSSMGIDLYDALSNCREDLLTFGGHRAAAGIKIRADQVDAFRESMFEAVSSQADIVEMVPELSIDIEASFAELTLKTLNVIEKMSPFGQSNPRPVLVASDVTIVGSPKKMGENDRHLSMKLDHHGIRLRAVAFGKGDWAEELEQAGGPFDFAFHPVINEFRGMRNVELQLIDWRISSSKISEGKLVSAASDTSQ